MNLRRCAYGTMIGLSLVSGSPVHVLAQATASPPAATPAVASPANIDAEARVIFEAGTIAYEAGRYADALARFQEAHRLSGRPSLLWNVAIAADRDRQDALALATYQRFLAETPETTSPDLRARAEQRVATLTRSIGEAREALDRAERAEQERLAAEQARQNAVDHEARALQQAAEVDAVEPTRITQRWWFWTIMGAGVVTAVAVPVGVHASRDTGSPFPGELNGGSVVFALSGRF